MKEYIKAFLNKLLCLHQWKLEHERKKIKTSYESNEVTGISFSRLYICKKCGKMKVLKQ